MFGIAKHVKKWIIWLHAKQSDILNCNRITLVSMLMVKIKVRDN